MQRDPVAQYLALTIDSSLEMRRELQDSYTQLSKARKQIDLSELPPDMIIKCEGAIARDILKLDAQMLGAIKLYNEIAENPITFEQEER